MTWSDGIVTVGPDGQRVANATPEEEAANAVVCAKCGSDDLASIERTIDWQRVTYEWTPAGIMPRDDSWGDNVGDSDSVTMGVACTYCSTETYDADDFRDGKSASDRAFQRRFEFEASHPPMEWTVSLIRIVKAGEYGAGDPRPYTPPEYESSEKTVTARTEREAMELAGEYGMVDGRYPWRPNKAVPADTAV